MKFLIDNQLPVALARFMAERGVACQHVRDLGFDTSSDEEIWRFSLANQYTIVSKDDDFQIMVNRRGPPPQVVWVRLGNCRKSALFEVFGRMQSELQAALATGSAVVEIR